MISRLRAVGSFSVATCAVVAGELILMAAYSGRKAENLPLFRRFLSTIPVGAKIVWPGSSLLREDCLAG